jgi:hypothetical protein
MEAVNPAALALARRCGELVKRLREDGIAAVRVEKFNELLGGDVREILHLCDVRIRDGYVVLVHPTSRIIAWLCDRKVLRAL